MGCHRNGALCGIDWRKENSTPVIVWVVWGAHQPRFPGTVRETSDPRRQTAIGGLRTGMRTIMEPPTMLTRMLRARPVNETVEECRGAVVRSAVTGKAVTSGAPVWRATLQRDKLRAPDPGPIRGSVRTAPRRESAAPGHGDRVGARSGVAEHRIRRGSLRAPSPWLAASDRAGRVDQASPTRSPRRGPCVPPGRGQAQG